MSAQVSFFTKFQIEYCYKCGVPFCFSEDFYKRRQDDGHSFFCPNGHSQHYTESTVQKLQKQIEQEKKRREWAESSKNMYRDKLESERRSKAAIRGQLTRTKKRIQNGICPCCKRTFQNLMRHMKTKHPNYSKDKERE